MNDKKHPYSLKSENMFVEWVQTLVKHVNVALFLLEANKAQLIANKVLKKLRKALDSSQKSVVLKFQKVTLEKGAMHPDPILLP